MIVKDAKKRLTFLASPDVSKSSVRFFKTGPGQSSAAFSRLAGYRLAAELSDRIAAVSSGAGTFAIK